MEDDLVSATIAALEERDEERLASEIAARPRILILQYSTRAANDGTSDADATDPPELSDEKAAALKTALVTYVLRSRGPYLETALSCLGAFRDPALKGFLRDQLRKCLTDPGRFSGALSQCMIALDALGEPVIAGPDFKADDIDANARAAEDYLMGNPA